ncbi:hypothetical protein I302_107756 [Kwoniella bestiolae CBS 10118]|uniref:Uncharacterized protein n=1 Tax=Kwoniella bestiolae CBS 10118 TaxID=1296100 RepID=A0A1B9FXM0_9TREE|nr:hypothetical protein I302_06505 [Kwoniella bestiolae CBS 10118]OCF23522.1 hypothetical protein I302_06505 [Kwoniella bestiolae CBS 10118]
MPASQKEHTNPHLPGTGTINHGPSSLSPDSQAFFEHTTLFLHKADERSKVESKEWKEGCLYVQGELEKVKIQLGKEIEENERLRKELKEVKDMKEMRAMKVTSRKAIGERTTISRYPRLSNLVFLYNVLHPMWIPPRGQEGGKRGVEVPIHPTHLPHLTEQSEDLQEGQGQLVLIQKSTSSAPPLQLVSQNSCMDSCSQNRGGK